MEHSMKLVEAHCGKYLQMFGECIQQFPHTWQMDCEPLRRKLSKCAETKPEIVHIKTKCGTEFQSYEECMRDNHSDSEKCAEQFISFSTCAEQALEAFKAQKLKKQSGPNSRAPFLSSTSGDTEDKR